MSCEFENERAILEKVIEKGFADQQMPTSYEMTCECNNEFTMDTFLKECPKCNLKYVVTPCSADSQENIVIVRD